MLFLASEPRRVHQQWMETTERLEIAALKIEGSIYTGETSSAAASQFFRAPGDAARRIALMQTAEAGFMTNRGRFVSQVEGEKLAKSAGQNLVGGAIVPAGRERVDLM
jgi:hypothetical protein